MSIVLLLMIVLTGQLEGMTVRLYGRKNQDGGMFFNAIICAFLGAFFLVTDKGGLYFPKELFMYSCVGAIATATGFYAAYLAFKYGSFIITKLIGSLSSVIVIVYGIVFLKEPTDLFGYLGIALFFISTFMMNLKGVEEKEKKSFTVKWLVCAVLTAISNGLLGILMRSQQIKFDGAYDNEYMMINAFCAAIILAVIGFVTEREKISGAVKKGLIYGAVTGGLNGVKTLFTLAIYLYMPLSIYAPLSVGLSCIAGFIVSTLIYKEQFTKIQLLGIFLGVLSVVMFAL